MLGRIACIASLALLACTRAPDSSPAPSNAGDGPSATPEPADAKAGEPRPDGAETIASDPAASPPAPTTNDPPPTPGVNDLYLAFGSGGLVRIAGVDSKVQVLEAFDRRTVVALAADAEGHVYAADPATIRVLDDGAVIREHAYADIAVGFLRALHATSERAIWALGTEGLAHFDGDRWQAVPLPEGGLQYPRDVIVDAAGHVWVMGVSELLRRDGERFSPVALLPDAKALRGFLVVPGHALSIVHSNGIDHFDDERWTSEDLGFVLGAHVPTGRVWGTVAADMAGGTIAVASHMQVTSRSEPHRRAYELNQEKHPITKIEAVEVDGRGRTWVATDGGLLVLEGPKDELRWIGPGAIPGVESAVSRMLAQGDGPALPALVDPGRGVVRGKLRHRGKPLADARVQICAFPSLEGSKGSPCEFTDHLYGTRTAADGTFELTDVLPGRYRMAVTVTPNEWRYLWVDGCCLATRPGAPQDLGTIDAKSGDKEGW